MKNNIPRYFIYAATSLYPLLCSAQSMFTSVVSVGEKITVLILICAVCFCACEDLITRTIPNFFNAIIFASGLTFSLFQGGFRNATKVLFGSFILTVILLAIFFAAKGGIGGGDIKLVAAASAFIGPMNAVTVFFEAALLAAPLSLHLLLLSKLRRCRPRPEPCRAPGETKRTKQPLSLPFGPFYAICLLFELYNII